MAMTTKYSTRTRGPRRRKSFIVRKRVIVPSGIELHVTGVK